MSQPPRATIATILFTDLVGSTELMQRVGDERAQRLFQAHHELLSNYLAEVASLLWMGAQSPLAWRLAQQGLRHVGGRRDRTWAVLDAHESLRREAEDPERIGFPTAARTRFAAFRSFLIGEMEELIGFLPVEEIGSRGDPRERGVVARRVGVRGR
jgi:hypothetical protein